MLEYAGHVKSLTELNINKELFLRTQTRSSCCSIKRLTNLGHLKCSRVLASLPKIRKDVLPRLQTSCLHLFTNVHILLSNVRVGNGLPKQT